MIQNGDLDENVFDYVRKVSEQDDVSTLNNQVDELFYEALLVDEQLDTAVSEINIKIERDTDEIYDAVLNALSEDEQDYLEQPDWG